MALTPDQAKQKAMDAATSAAEEKVAIFLKQQLGNIAAIPDYKDKGILVPTEDEEYRRMATQLISERKLTASTESGGTLDISLKDLDAKDEKYGTGIRASQEVHSFEELVPSRDQLNSTANAIGEGVRENTGTIGFLGGATLKNAFMGFMKWIGGLFTGKSSFSMASIKEAIASVTAENMKESVTDNLSDLRKKYPSMNRFLSDSTIMDIGNQVNDRALQEAGLTPPARNDGLAATTAVTLENATPVTADSNQLAKMRMEVRDGILNPPGQKTLGEMIGDEMEAKRRWYSFLKGVSEADVRKSANKVADVVADTVSATVTDPAFRTKDGRKLADLNRDEFATTVSDEVGKALLAKEESLGLPVNLKDKTDDDKARPDKTHLDASKDRIRDKLMEESKDGSPSAYEKLSLVANITGKTDIPQSARELADGAVDPGVRDATSRKPAEHLEDGTTVAALTHASSGRANQPSNNNIYHPNGGSTR